MSDPRGIQAQNGLEHKWRVHGRIDCRVGTYKEQFQPFIWKLRRQSHLHGILSEKLESALARLGYLPVAHLINKGMARRRQQPGFGILRHTVARPSRECCYQSVAEGVLRAGHV